MTLTEEHFVLVILLSLTTLKCSIIRVRQGTTSSRSMTGKDTKLLSEKLLFLVKFPVVHLILSIRELMVDFLGYLFAWRSNYPSSLKGHVSDETSSNLTGCVPLFRIILFAFFDLHILINVR